MDGNMNIDSHQQPQVVPQGQIQMPVAQVPQLQLRMVVNPRMFLEAMRPRRDFVGGAVMAPISTAQNHNRATRKRKVGQRGKGRAGTTRKRKCKACLEIGQSDEEREEACPGKWGFRNCKYKELVLANRAARRQT